MLMSATPTEPHTLRAEHCLQISDYFQQQICKGLEAHNLHNKEVTTNQLKIEQLVQFTNAW